jgi:hypothetical protein
MIRPTFGAAIVVLKEISRHWAIALEMVGEFGYIEGTTLLGVPSVWIVSELTKKARLDIGLS